jgi:hypothetical protein
LPEAAVQVARPEWVASVALARTVLAALAPMEGPLAMAVPAAAAGQQQQVLQVMVAQGQSAAVVALAG